ncbi:hypothetical protein GCM10023340_16020 [Nocardioides marinquilinus]|uniref:Integral membrane protein n=1 Tax=Nocardioides marinquilinus TaxID=1210400 RepID=A0ABP9PFW4_9ACTN
MCFSVEADLAAGGLLVPLGVVALRGAATAGDRRLLPLTSLPVLFGLHQLVEALVWAGVDGDVSAGLARAAAWVYVGYALVVLPLLLPVAVWLVAERRARPRVVPFVALGAVTAAAMTVTTARHGLTVVPYDHAIGYFVGLGPDDWLWTSTYVVACMGACLASGHRLLVGFGVVNLVGLTVVAVAYAEALASLWCVYAAVSSVLVVAFVLGRARAAATEQDLQEATA